jgi:hypothetical protein
LELLPLIRVETEALPLGKRLIGTRERALQNEVADGALRSGRSRAQRLLRSGAQAQVELFGADTSASGHDQLRR